MSIGSRFVLFVVLVMAGLVCSLPTRLAREMDGWFGLPQARSIEALRQTEEDLERKMELILSRIQAREGVIEDLLQDRISFAEAVVAFLTISNRYPCFAVDFSPFPGKTPEERAAQHVMQWVRVALQRHYSVSSPTRFESLEREMQEWLCQSDGAFVPTHLR